MSVIWGKLAGLGLGVFGGPIGAAFGLFVGHLLDVVAAEFLLRRSLARFLMGPQVRASRRFDPATAVAALAVVSVVNSGWRPSADDTSAFMLGVNGWAGRSEREHFAERWMQMVRGQRGRYLDAALHLQSDLHLESFASRVTAEIAMDDRPKVIEICRSTLGAAARGPVLERLRSLAQLIDLPDEWIGTALPAPANPAACPRIDTEACAILGVESDAGLAEVKLAYRRLAAQFHPDTATVLSTEQQAASAAAFVRITSAYDRVVSQLTGGR
ncbi:MAG: DnaJ domain-containing protein [Spirochaetia bacterium]